MDPRDFKHLPCTFPDLARHDEPQSFRLLDLPTEIRLMIYGYAIGYLNASWTVVHDTRQRCLLTLDDILNPIERLEISQNRCFFGLLQACRLVSQEIIPILYNQTRFDIRFLREWRLRCYDGHLLLLEHIPGGIQPNCALARLVLQRVKHVRLFFDQGTQMCYDYESASLLCLYLAHGEHIKSLRVTFNKSDFLTDGTETWFASNMLNLRSYRGHAILVCLEDDPTEEDIAAFKGSLKCNVLQLLPIADEC